MTTMGKLVVVDKKIHTTKKKGLGCNTNGGFDNCDMRTRTWWNIEGEVDGNIHGC